MPGEATAIRDFYTNPTFRMLLTRVRTMQESENTVLRSTMRGETELNATHQAGVVDGIERMYMLLENECRSALK